jgi:hypothetical protein
MWQRLKAVFLEAHKHPDTFLAYIVSLSIAVQTNVDNIDDYISVGWRHTMVGAATAIVIIDRVLKSIRCTKPPDS